MKKILNFRPLFYSFIAFFSAILSAKYIFTTSWLYIGILIVLLFTFLIFSILKNKIKTFICILIFFSAGLFGYAIEMKTYDVKSFPSDVVITGRVCGESIQNGSLQKIILNQVSVQDESIKENVLLYVFGAPYLSAGDTIQFTGDINKSGALHSSGSFRTDYYKYNIRYIASTQNSNIEILGNDRKLNETIQLAVKENLEQNMDKKNAKISYAMLFGDQSEIDETTMSDYRVSGIAHILSISGLHVSIIVAFLYWILKKFSKNWIIFLIITILLVFYCYLCGFSSTVVRASIMSVCLLGSILLGRQYDSLSAVGLAGLIILAIAPLYAFDIGFQLSFGCIIGIAIFYRTINSALRKIKLHKRLAAPLAMSISAQLFIFPVMINAFGQSSILSVFLNIIVIPIFSVAYITIFLTTPLMFLDGFFQNFLWFAGILMEGIAVSANYVAGLIWSVIPKIQFAFIAFISFYAIIFISSRMVFLKPKTKLITCLSITLVTVLIVGLAQLI
jgi:competence protein ComEC